MITPNSHEARILCGQIFEASHRQQALEAAKCLVGQGPEIVVITLAEFGLVYASSETSGHVPAVRTKIVDPTGAGDALTAAVIFGLLNEVPLDDAVRLGVTAASLTLRQSGTVIPNLSQALYDQLDLIHQKNNPCSQSFPHTSICLRRSPRLAPRDCPSLPPSRR
jgi:pseudouridine kinase